MHNQSCHRKDRSCLADFSDIKDRECTCKRVARLHPKKRKIPAVISSGTEQTRPPLFGFTWFSSALSSVSSGFLAFGTIFMSEIGHSQLGLFFEPTSGADKPIRDRIGPRFNLPSDTQYNYCTVTGTDQSAQGGCPKLLSFLP